VVNLTENVALSSSALIDFKFIEFLIETSSTFPSLFNFDLRNGLYILANRLWVEFLRRLPNCSMNSPAPVQNHEDIHQRYCLQGDWS
jgi:hypothetical protein